MLTRGQYNDIIKAMVKRGIPEQEAESLLKPVDVIDWKELSLRCQRCKKVFHVRVSRFCALPPAICNECELKGGR